MPHPIVEIDELVRPTIDYLVEISPRTAVSFALTCRSLEEPALSSLWKQQHSLIVLVKVLPQLTLIEEDDRLAMEGDPLPEDWDRLRRYASRMRKLHLSGRMYITADTLSRLSCNSPDGVLCPKLEQLDWSIYAAGALLPFFRLFLSPRLKVVYVHSLFGYKGELSYLAEVISCLPTSLNTFLVFGREGESLADPISSFVYRCGPSLTTFGSDIRLSAAAIHHLMRLPNLRSWFVVNEPPQAVLPSVFPPLEWLNLGEPTALPWLHLLAMHGESGLRSRTGRAMLRTDVKETLKDLICSGGTTIDSRLLSSILVFRNLVTLRMKSHHCQPWGVCAFLLTDNDVESLAVALPSLTDLEFGRVCDLNSCRTTVSSLLSISTHCLGLTSLEIHFNTRTIVDDMQRLLDGGSGRGKPRCGLRKLLVGCLGLRVGRKDIGTLLMGFADIFPRLDYILSSKRGDWEWWSPR